MSKRYHPKKQMILIPITLFSILAVLLMGIYPNNREISQLDQEIVKLKAMIVQQDKIAPLFKKIISEIQKPASPLMPKEPDPSPFTIHPDHIAKNLKQLADAHHLVIEKLSSHVPFDKWESGILPYRISLSGPLIEIRQMLLSLSRLNFIKGIERFHLSTVKERRTIVLNLLIHLKSADAPLSKDK